MLEHIEGAETVCSPNETLALERTFDLVLLMSFVIDVADDDLRAAFLRTCRRHVSPDGCVILQRKPPEWYDTIEANERVTADGRTYRLTDLQWPAPNVLSATMEYTVGERHWTHTFVSQRLEDSDLVAALEVAGLEMTGFLDGDREWSGRSRSARARPSVDRDRPFDRGVGHEPAVDEHAHDVVDVEPGAVERRGASVGRASRTPCAPPDSWPGSIATAAMMPSTPFGAFVRRCSSTRQPFPFGAPGQRTSTTISVPALAGRGEVTPMTASPMDTASSRLAPPWSPTPARSRSGCWRTGR